MSSCAAINMATTASNLLAEEAIASLVQQERDCQDRIDLSSRKALHENIGYNDTWRQKVVDWCYKLVDHLDIDREIVYIAMNILDRFLATQTIRSKQKYTQPQTETEVYPPSDYFTDKRAYELAVMTSLLLSLKLQGKSDLDITDLVKMSKYSITTQDILLMGKTIVRTLSWNCQLPTAARFTHALIQLLPASSTVPPELIASIFEESIFQLELSVYDLYCSTQSPSLLAWMAIENAMDKVMCHSKSSSSLSQTTTIRSTFSATVSRVTGHKLDTFICTRLRRLQMINCGTEKTDVVVPTLIPNDDDYEASQQEQPQQPPTFQAAAIPSHRQIPLVVSDDEFDTQV